MAIEIIEVGVRPQDTVYQQRCRKCNSVIRFLQSDAKITYDQRDGDFLTIKCPVCENDMHTSLKR